MIILASQSPRRHELMKLTGLPFTVRVADIDETMDPALPVQQEVTRVSRLKAQTIAAGAAAEFPRNGPARAGGRQRPERGRAGRRARRIQRALRG